MWVCRWQTGGMPGPTRLPRAWARRTLNGRDRQGFIAPTIVAVLGVAFWLTGWRGVDHPAQAFRVTLFEQHGFTAWNTQWYAGHHTPGYGVLYPAVASVLGEAAVAIAATVASVAIFDVLMRGLVQRRAATAAFAVMMLINLWEGRLPFAVGVAFGLAALALAGRGRWWPAGLAAVLSSLGSPLAGAFVALVAASWAVAATDPKRPVTVVRHPASWLAVVAVVPVIALAVLYPQGGFMPFLWQHFVLTVLGAAGAIALGMGSSSDPSRIGGWRSGDWSSSDMTRRVAMASAAFTIAAAVLFFFLETPVGGNLARLAVLAGPALIAIIGTRWGVALGVGLMLWHATPLLGIPAAIDDPARDAAYHQPLIEAIEDRVGESPTRLEIPFTERHWETAHVAPSVALARGWERQLDHRFNSVILSEDLTEEDYLEWLRETAVQLVAIPDIDLEPESDRQAEIVRTSGELSMVWSNDNWELFEVLTPSPLASSGVVLGAINPDRIELRLDNAGAHEVRVRYSPTMRFRPSGLSIGAAPACVREGAGGWTEIVSTLPVDGEIYAALPWAGDDGC